MLKHSIDDPLLNELIYRRTDSVIYQDDKEEKEDTNEPSFDDLEDTTDLDE